MGDVIASPFKPHRAVRRVSHYQGDPFSLEISDRCYRYAVEQLKRGPGDVYRVVQRDEFGSFEAASAAIDDAVERTHVPRIPDRFYLGRCWPDLGPDLPDAPTSILADLPDPDSGGAAA